MSWVATAIIGGAVIGTAGTVYASNKSTKAATNAANAQKDAQTQALADARADRERAYADAQKAALPSTEELAAAKRLSDRNESALTAQLSKIAEAQKVLDAVDPSVKEAGKQTLELLQGKTSAMLDPVIKGRDRQRLELENKLAARLGPGFRTSSAGIAALNSFDNDTTGIIANVQSQALNQVAGITSSLGALSSNIRANQVSQTNAAFGQALGVDTALLTEEGNLRTARTNAVNALLTGNSSVAQANNTLASNAGNQFAGQIGQANTFGNLAGNIGQAGISYGLAKDILSPKTGGYPAPDVPGTGGMPTAADFLTP